MASFRKMRDVNGWLADREEFEPKAMELKVGPLGRLFNLEYEVPEEGFLVSESHTEGGVEEGYFYLVAFDCRLRFPFPDFIVGVLNVYGIT